MKTEDLDIDALRARLKAVCRLLEDLTPMGSEFHDNPERCAAFIRERLNSPLRARIQAAEEAAESARELTEKLRASWLKDRNGLIVALEEADKEKKRLLDSAREWVEARALVATSDDEWSMVHSLRALLSTLEK